MSQKICWIFGATGLIGNHFMQKACENDHYQTIHVFSRRKIQFSHPKLNVHIIDFRQLESALSSIEPGDIFCCLGTTMKQAGSKEAFKFVDYFLPTEIARIGKQKSCQKYLLVSSMGADPNSMVFYSQVKGETESEIAKYQIKYTHFLRPSLLLGERDENRMGENIGKVVMNAINPLLIGPMRKYQAIKGETVAQAMLNIAIKTPDQKIFLSDEIKDWS